MKQKLFIWTHLKSGEILALRENGTMLTIMLDGSLKSTQERLDTMKYDFFLNNDNLKEKYKVIDIKEDYPEYNLDYQGDNLNYSLFQGAWNKYNNRELPNH